MIDNVFVQCDYCKTKLRLRFQMGYFDIPFDICCPNCGVHIHGLRKLENSHSTIVKNASIIQCEKDDVNYYADFSVELPHTKTTRYESDEQILKAGFSPFMMTSRLYGNEAYLKLVKNIGAFLSFRNFYWAKLTPLFDLFFNGKVGLAKEHFLKLSPRFIVKNELDALMALHQTIMLGMNAILPEGALQKFMIASDQIMAPESLVKLDDLISSLGGEEYFNSVSKRLVKIYDRWMVNFEKYIPVTMLSLGGAVQKFDKETLGIATTSFEDMKSFYADSYELILDFIDVAVGLNNIIVRGDCNSFPKNDIKVNKKTSYVGNFDNYREIVKSMRINLLMDKEPFSKVIPLNRNVRNAIAHFNYEFDAGTQRILFCDKHKNKDSTVEIYLIDLALLCYENITLLVYLDELLYALRKIHYVKEGMSPNIKPPK